MHFAPFSVLCHVTMGVGPMTSLIELHLQEMNIDQSWFDMTKHVLSYIKQIFLSNSLKRYVNSPQKCSIKS